MKTLFLTSMMYLTTFISVSQNLIPFKDENRKYGLKDEYGNVKVLAKYDGIDSLKNIFSTGLKLHFTKLNNKLGFIDSTGVEVVSPIYDNIEPFDNVGDYLLVTSNRKYGLIKNNGQVVLKPIYDYIKHLGYGSQFGAVVDDDYFQVKLDGKFGKFDINGNQISEFE